MDFQNALQHFLPPPEPWRISQPQDVGDGEIGSSGAPRAASGTGVWFILAKSEQKGLLTSERLGAKSSAVVVGVVRGAREGHPGLCMPMAHG